MIWALVVLAVVLTVVCYVDARSLAYAHAKPLAHQLNRVRWLVGLSCTGAATAASGTPLLVAAFVLSAGAMGIIRYQWLLAWSGGREPLWELRQTIDKAAALQTNAFAARMLDAKQAEGMEKLIKRMRSLRTPETAELCDLEMANCEDWLAPSRSILIGAWRHVRIHELECELYGNAARAAEFDRSEATFRWRLHRTLAWLVDVGAADVSPENARLFSALLDELEEYRRPDTSRFVDLVSTTARAWLAREPKTDPWVSRKGFAALDPALDTEYRRLWPRAAVFYGAQLDERDIKYLTEVAGVMPRVQAPGPSTHP
jgi:hypothetical protein